MRRPYFANALIDVQLPGQVVVTTPCERRADGRLLLFPFPQMGTDPLPRLPGAPARPPNVTLTGGTWFVNDALASTLPVTCPTQQAAQRLADVWLDAVTHESVDPAIGDQVEAWCWWFTKTYPEGGEYAPLDGQPRVQPANTDIMPIISGDMAPEAPQTEEESA